MNRLITNSLFINSLLVATAARAQVIFSVGPQAGLTVAGSSNNDRTNTTVNYRAGFEAGVQSIVQIGQVAVQPSLRFSQKGLYERTGSGLYSRYTNYRLNYLTLPINVAYSLRPDGQGLQVFAGPYAGLLLGGNYQRTSTDRSAGGGSWSSEGDIKPGERYYIPAPGTTYLAELCHRFDVGVQAGLGYRFGPFLAQADFSFGLRDLGPYLDPYHNRTAQVSLAYLFKLNR
jgi:hypothetical protein